MTRAVLVHALPDALAALEAAGGAEVLLASAAGAAGYAGAGWWVELAALARAAHPGSRAVFLLDCAESAGDALGALRVGVTEIAFRGTAAQAAAVARITAASGARILPYPAETLDLRGRKDAVAACRRWLSSDMPHLPA